MPYHYTKSGHLDMRYSSSKAAVASASYSSGRTSSGGSSGSSSYGNSSYGYSSSSQQGNLRKDGSLDMRYASSQQAASLVSPSSYVTPSSPYENASSGYSSASSPDNLHYKKDGTLDMRYSSSKSSVLSSSSSFNPSTVHLKKDGTPDMRFKSSQEIAHLDTKLKDVHISSKSEIHLKKDGTLDMRYTSSKLAMEPDSSFRSRHGIPGSIPLTKSGQPDMRTKVAKLWVEDQGRKWSSDKLPTWIMRKKDGTIDITNAAVRAFINFNNRADESVRNDHTCREKYYEKRNLDSDFRSLVDQARGESVYMPQHYILPYTDNIRRELADATGSQMIECPQDIPTQIPSSIPLLDYTQLKASFAEEEKATLGRGSFGVVLKGLLHGQDVAVKRLHLANLNKKESQSFVKELKILALLGDHHNLVKLHGYTLDPPCLVMEYVDLGNLKYLLHYSEDPAIEAKLTDGRIKKLLAVGISDGMHQLHAAHIVHGDLKPANVLVTSGYVAKVSDFGLATLRGKTSSSIVSTEKDDGEAGIFGTVGYMAPELLDSSKRPEFSIDVYSFGVLLNEVIQEEEPYAEKFADFRGPFAPVIYAKNGNRPYVNQAKTPKNLQNLIAACWSATPSERPTFEDICIKLQQVDMKFPDSF